MYIESLSVMNTIPTRSLSTSFAKLLKHSLQNKEIKRGYISLHALCYINDMQLKLSSSLKQLVLNNIEVEGYSLNELSYLVIAL